MAFARPLLPFMLLIIVVSLLGGFHHVVQFEFADTSEQVTNMPNLALFHNVFDVGLQLSLINDVLFNPIMALLRDDQSRLLDDCLILEVDLSFPDGLDFNDEV